MRVHKIWSLVNIYFFWKLFQKSAEIPFLLQKAIVLLLILCPLFLTSSIFGEGF